MTTFIIEIHPKKAAFDPLARSVRSELIEAGEFPENADVITHRLFKITGDFTDEQAQRVADTLLVDPVVETVVVTGKKAAKGKIKAGTWVLDIWPKPGVTDPVGETVEKGLRDLGFQGEVHAMSAQRYIFPSIKNTGLLKSLAKQTLANELIHDINLAKLN